MTDANTTTREPDAQPAPPPAATPIQPGTEIAKIDAKFDRNVVAGTEIDPGQGILFRRLPELVEAAKLMARADICLPVHCRDNPNICFAILMRTNNWKLLDPFFVAEHSYVVEKNAKGDDGKWMKVKTLAFDSAIFQAALLASGAIQGRPQYEYTGTGDDMTCTVSVQLVTGEWESHTSPPLKTAHPGFTKKDDGTQYVRGSPLWTKNPQQQLGYFTLRDLVRLKFQDVLAGFYDRDEYEETPVGPDGATIPPSPNLAERLPGRIAGAGFQEKVDDPTLEKGQQTQPERQRSRKATPDRLQGKGNAKQPVGSLGWQKGKKPTTAAEYSAYAKAWIASTPDKGARGRRWLEERGLRADLRVKLDERKALEKLPAKG